MNAEPDGIRDFNPDTSPDDEGLNDKSDEGGAQDKSKRFDYLDSDPESEKDESTVEPSAAELVSGGEKHVDTTLNDVYSQVDELERGNEPIMDQGMGAEDLSELPYWKRPFARLSKKNQKSEKGVDLNPSEEPPEKILDEEISATTVEPVVSIEEGITPKPIEEISPAAPSITIDEVRAVVNEEINRIEADLSNLVQQEVDTKLAAYKPKTSAGMGLWATVSGLILISAVGVAGILLLRQTNDENSRSLVEIAALYQASGKPDDAIRTLDNAVEAGITDAETLGRVGELYRELKQYDQSIEIMTKLVEREPENEDYRLSLALSLGGAGQHQDAITQYKQLVEINPGNWLYYREMGTNYEILKDYDKAIAQYQKVYEVAPSRVEGNYFQGNLYRKLERYDEAIEAFQLALEVNPNHYWSHVYAGVSYVGKRDYENAIKHYQSAIAILPENQNAYFYLGEAYLGQGHFEDALEPYQRAVELKPDWASTMASAHLGLGKVYLNLNDCVNATVEFMEVLRLQPDNQEAQEGLAACKED